MENELTFSAQKIKKREYADEQLLDGALLKALKIDPTEIVISDGPLLGEGAFAEVKLGKWLGVDVACKYFTRGNQFKEFDAFRREIEVHATLRHPNILIVLGVSVSPQRLIVTEYMALGTLRDVIRDAPFLLTEQKTHKVIYEIALGMYYLHSRMILHRDLRSGNVLMSRDFVAKIGDFNLACREYDPKDSMGAMSWMAPEVLLSVGNFTTKSDVYSYAITLWEIFSKKSPPRFMTVDHAVELVAKARERFIMPNDAARFAPLIEKSWAHDPLERPTFEQVLDRMHEISPDLIPGRKNIAKVIKLGAADDDNDDYPDVFMDDEAHS